jgi:hypothetical protein
MRWVLRMVVVTCLLCSISHSSHILLLPFPYHSHVNQLTSIGAVLLERGHAVTMLVSESYPELEQIRNESGFRVVSYAVVDPDFYSWDLSNSTSDWLTDELTMEPLDEMRANAQGEWFVISIPFMRLYALRH